MAEEYADAVCRPSLSKKQKLLILMAAMWILGWMMGFSMGTGFEACEGICV